MEFVTTTAEKVFFYIACVSTIIFGIKIIIMSFIGDLHHDASFVSDAGNSTSDFGVFSINSVLCFFMGTGWVGLASLREWGVTLAPSMVLAVAGGIFCTFIFCGFLYLSKKLNHDVKPFSVKAGDVGTVYMRINAHGIGQVMVRNKIVKATSDQDIDSFKSVRFLEDKEIDINTVTKVEIL